MKRPSRVFEVVTDRHVEYVYVYKNPAYDNDDIVENLVRCMYTDPQSILVRHMWELVIEYMMRFNKAWVSWPVMFSGPQEHVGIYLKPHCNASKRAYTEASPIDAVVLC